MTRTIASSAIAALSARKITVSMTRRRRSRGSRQNLVPGGGGWNNSARKALRTGHNIRPAMIALQRIRAGVQNQPTRKRAMNAGGTRLRRRLAKICEQILVNVGDRVRVRINPARISKDA